MKNTIIYLIGNPGVGKYTVAKELCKNYPELKLIDNHIPANLVFSFSSNTKHPRHMEYRFRARALMLEAIGEISEPEDAFVFTNVLLKGENDWYDGVENLAKSKNAMLVPIILTCSLEENKRRIINEERKLKFKTTDAQTVDSTIEDGIVEFEHPNKLVLDTSNLSPQKTCGLIMEHIKNKCV